MSQLLLELPPHLVTQVGVRGRINWGVLWTAISEASYSCLLYCRPGRLGVRLALLGAASSAQNFHKGAQQSQEAGEKAADPAQPDSPASCIPWLPA